MFVRLVAVRSLAAVRSLVAVRLVGLWGKNRELVLMWLCGKGPFEPFV